MILEVGGFDAMTALDPGWPMLHAPDRTHLVRHSLNVTWR